MPSKMRHGLLISLVVISLIVISFTTSYTDTTNYIYDELNRLIRVEYEDGNIIEYIYDATGNRSHLYVGKYTLTVNVVGNGTVTKNPDQPIYSSGTNVTLTAVNGSQTFSEWSGDLTGSTNPSGIEMNGNKSVTATFVTPEPWLQGWTYRKAVTLSRASGAVTNYQMRLLVGETSEASGENVDCNGHVQADFDDLRFTTSDKTTLLDYWIESITGTTPNQLATVWIKFDSIGTSATTFYMYYGNAGAGPASNGFNTFIVFDDFERGNNGDAVGGSWTVDAGSVQISTDHAYGGTRSAKWLGNSGGSYPYARVSKTDGTNYAIRYRIYKETAANFFVQHGNGTHVYAQNFDTSEHIGLLDGAAYTVLTMGTADTWQLIELSDLTWGASPTCDLWVNDALIADNTPAHYNQASYDDKIEFGGWPNNTGVDYYIDDLVVRQWNTTAPTWGAWGAEESN